MLDEVKMEEEARVGPLLEQNDKLRRLTKEQDEAIAALQKVPMLGMERRLSMCHCPAMAFFNNGVSGYLPG